MSYYIILRIDRTLPNSECVLLANVLLKTGQEHIQLPETFEHTASASERLSKLTLSHSVHAVRSTSGTT
jgi:hypothetical protein